MFELYYYPGACSLAAHIALNETNTRHVLRHVDLMSGEQDRAEYRAIHPLGRVPALRISETEVLTELSAILFFLDARSDVPTLPKEGGAFIEAVRWLSVLSTSVHVPFSVYINPRRVSDNAELFPSLKEDCKKRGFEMLRYVDSALSPEGTVLSHASLIDGYAMCCYFWGVMCGLPVQTLKRYTLLVQRMVARPAVERALSTEGLGSVVGRLFANRQ